MNNDSPPPAPEPSNDSQDPAGDTAAERARIQEALSPAQKRAQSQTKWKYEFVNSMMASLDTVIYVELCIVYYMDCSFFRLVIRAISQLVFLTPKPNFIPPLPQHRPYVPAIFVPNVICMLLHIFTARSEAGEAMRGYLHGGIIIDLIGQKGPTSKLHLLLLDFIILGLQCFMLAVHVERERLAAALAAILKPGMGQPLVEVISAQDQDAEERGVVREGVLEIGIEMQPMDSQADGPSTDRHGDVDLEQARLDDPPPREDTEDDDNPLDLYWSATTIIADFHILHTLRRQWEDRGNASASALQNVGFSAEFAAVTANRRFNAASERLQRSVQSLSG